MIEVTNYVEQEKTWPDTGKHIMAQFDAETVIVYQAYNPRIAEFAAREQYFGDDFKYSRMSWIKPNFLWMMYRCGWATKEGQEHVLAIHLYRDFFDEILKNAHPSYCPEQMDREEWKAKMPTSNVRLQWDPDHDPYGNNQVRKAIQLGLRENFLKPFQGEGIKEIEDITDFVRKQHQILQTEGLDALSTPREEVYEVGDEIKSTLDMKMD